MPLEEGLTPIEELQWELGGLLIPIQRDGGDRGLDDTGDVDGEDTPAGLDGAIAGRRRKEPREIELYTTINPAGTEDADELHLLYADQLNELRKVLDLLPDRYGSRLLRFRRRGEAAKRIAVVPPVGKSLVLPGDEARLQFARSTPTIRLLAPDPVIVSDEYHVHTFTTAGEEATITNAGSFTALHPAAWWLTSEVPVTITHVEFGETVAFPDAPVSVSTRREIISATSYNVCRGPAGQLAPQWPVLRPGDNTIRASAPCAFYWRDTF